MARIEYATDLDEAERRHALAVLCLQTPCEGPTGAQEPSRRAPWMTTGEDIGCGLVAFFCWVGDVEPPDCNDGSRCSRCWWPAVVPGYYSE